MAKQSLAPMGSAKCEEFVKKVVEKSIDDENFMPRFTVDM